MKVYKMSVDTNQHIYCISELGTEIKCLQIEYEKKLITK